LNKKTKNSKIKIIVRVGQNLPAKKYKNKKWRNANEKFKTTKRHNPNSINYNKTRACRLKSRVAGFFVYLKTICDSTV